jgi:hypothetical protein
MGYEFVYKVENEVLSKEQVVGKAQSQSEIRSVRLKDNQLSQQASEQLSDLEEWTGFGKVIGFRDASEKDFRVRLLDFIPFNIVRGCVAIRPQISTYNHTNLSRQEIELEIDKMHRQWQQTQAKLQSPKAGLKAHQKLVEKELDFQIPFRMRVWLNIMMFFFFLQFPEFGEKVPPECMWSYLGDETEKYEGLRLLS